MQEGIQEAFDAIPTSLDDFIANPRNIRKKEKKRKKKKKKKKTQKKKKLFFVDVFFFSVLHKGALFATTKKAYALGDIFNAPIWQVRQSYIKYIKISFIQLLFNLFFNLAPRGR
jgi:hypothetical protein